MSDHSSANAERETACQGTGIAGFKILEAKHTRGQRQALPEAGAQSYLKLKWPDDSALAALGIASVRYRIAVSPIAGHKTLRLQTQGIIR